MKKKLKVIFFLQRVSLSGFVYVFVSTVITVLVHELGHALAAARYKVLTIYSPVYVYELLLDIVFLMS